MYSVSGQAGSELEGEFYQLLQKDLEFPVFERMLLVTNPS